MTRRRVLHPLTEERFGPLSTLQRERWIPVPPYRPGLCEQGPTAAWYGALDSARRFHATQRRRVRQLRGAA